MCIKSEFKEICLKLATNGRSDKGFLLTSIVCPQGVLCPCPRAIYMYKIIKNVYKIRFQRDFFLNWQQMGKVIRTFCWHQNFVPKGLSVPALGLYTCIKSFFKEIVIAPLWKSGGYTGFALSFRNSVVPWFCHNSDKTWISLRPVGQYWSNFIWSIIRVWERLHKVLGQIGLKLWFLWQQKAPIDL